MLNSIFFLSDNYRHFADIINSNNEPGFYLSFLADASDRGKLKEAYRFFSDTEVPNFSLSLTINNKLTSSSLQEILSFFFIPAYYHVNNQPILNLISGDNDLLESTQKEIKELSVRQGFENLTVLRLDENGREDQSLSSSQNSRNYLFTNTEKFVDHYIAILKCGNIYNNAFYLHDPQIEPGKLYSIIAKAEDEFKKNNLAFYETAGKIQSLLSENEQLKKKYLCLANELDNYKKHLEVMRSSHEAKELQEYYNNQYEILPLWYKRVGHVLKVLMGKRKIRSLFNDNIKKYKA